MIFSSTGKGSIAHVAVTSLGQAQDERCTRKDWGTQELAKPGYATIGVTENEYNRIKAYCNKYKMSPAQLLEKVWDDHEKTIEFATKITKIPKTVRVDSIK